MENQHRQITGYRELDEDEISEVNQIKTLASQIGHMIENMTIDPDLDQRCVALAKTKFQEAFMWAIRSVTKPESFG